MARSALMALLVAATGCATAFEERIEEPLTPEELEADYAAMERAQLAAARRARPRASLPASSRSFGAAAASLVPYGTRSFGPIRSLWEAGQHDPGADEARYLAAAASLDLAAYAVFHEDAETISTLAHIRGLATADLRASLFAAIGAELRSVQSPTYGPAAQALAEGAALLQQGPDAPRGSLLAVDILRRRAPAAHLASLFYVDAVRRGVEAFVRDGSGLAKLAGLGDDPCARGCDGSPLATAPEPTRRATAAVSRAWTLLTRSLEAGDADPFGALARPEYERARAVLARVPLPDQSGPRGRSASRVLVELGLQEAKMSLLPHVEIVEGRVIAEGAPTPATASQTVRYLTRWPAKVTPYEPFTQAARAIRAATGRSAEAAAPPVAIGVDDELEAHIFARVILSLMAVGFDDFRLRRPDGDGFRETRLRPVAGGQVDEAAVRGRAKVEVYGPFDYDGAERTFRRFAAAGRPPSAQLVLFALIASRALHRALDAVRVAWPEQDADILLVLPQQVP